MYPPSSADFTMEELEKAIRTDLATYSSDIAIQAVDGGQYDLGDEIGTVSVGLVRGVCVWYAT